MNAEIISIADEILIGQIVNTNATFISQALSDVGIHCNYVHTVRDHKEDILQAIDLAYKRSNLVILTGGLGPTNDDLTKDVLCDYFDDTLIVDNDVLNDITSFFKSKGREDISKLNKEQALVPSKAKIFRNAIGTAPAIYLNKSNHLVAFPGVPYEMKFLLNKFLSYFKKKYNLPFILHQTVFVKNIPESQLASLLNEWENNLHHKLKLAYLPKPGIVRLRLSSEGNDLQQLKKITDNELHKLSKLVVYEEILEDVFNKIHDFFTLNNYTLSVAESCSGGVIASKITANAGASSYFRGGVVAYSDDIKHKFLNIDKDLIKKYSSVSKQVAEVMSNNCCEIFNSDFSISTTGYAGPSLDNAQQPVGTVFISITSPTSTNVSKYQFSGDRELVISQVLDKSLDLIYKEIKKLK
tara:strand:- start:12600 stop:13832 length:1233 start_codon:yes stop_codon:yes gene_type:complete